MLFGSSESSINKTTLGYGSDKIPTLLGLARRILNTLFDAHAVNRHSDDRSSVHPHLFYQLLNDARMGRSELQVYVYGVWHIPMIMVNLWELYGSLVGALWVDTWLLPSSPSRHCYPTLVLYSPCFYGPTILMSTTLGSINDYCLSGVIDSLMLLNQCLFAISNFSGYVSLAHTSAKETNHAIHRTADIQHYGSGGNWPSPQPFESGYRLRVSDAALSSKELPGPTSSYQVGNSGSASRSEIGAVCLA